MKTIKTNNTLSLSLGSHKTRLSLVSLNNTYISSCKTLRHIQESDILSVVQSGFYGYKGLFQWLWRGPACKTLSSKLFGCLDWLQKGIDSKPHSFLLSSCTRLTMQLKSSLVCAWGNVRYSVSKVGDWRVWVIESEYKEVFFRGNCLSSLWFCLCLRFISAW